ncbi:MAG: hypothetical protein U0Y10_19010 [Spirosomataceae bacterium]
MRSIFLSAFLSVMACAVSAQRLSIKQKLNLCNQLANQQSNDIALLKSEKANLIDNFQSLNKDVLATRDEVRKLTSQNAELSKKLSDSIASLKSLQEEVKRLKYEKAIWNDESILRVYSAAPQSVKESYLKTVATAEGFKFTEGTDPNVLLITKQFNQQAETWWVFDKTLDTILEIALTIKPHGMDPKQTLVSASTKLLQKTRFSNQPFEEQRDEEKVHFYRDKVLKLIESKLESAKLK